MSEIGEINGVKIMLSKEQYKEYRGTLNEQLESANKEIERLKTELQDTKEHLGEYLHEQEEENKRLNNIINELEKWLEKEQLNSVDLDEWTIIQVRDKILELKGSEKE